jgi:hypothetical protein
VTPYLITCLNDIPGKERWIAGVRDTLRDSVTPVIIMWQPHFSVPAGWIVRRMAAGYPGNLQRFLPLLDMDLDPTRWFIFTDGADVLFQHPLPDLDAIGKSVLLAAEGETHGANAFWPRFLDHPLYADLVAQPIYNAGTWAAKGQLFLEFVRFLDATQRLCQERGWPVVQYHDQLIFNQWVARHPERCGELPGLFCTLYANFTGPAFNGSGPARLEGGRFVDAQGRPYAIVHANGSTKGLLDRLYPPTENGVGGYAALLRTGE